MNQKQFEQAVPQVRPLLLAIATAMNIRDEEAEDIAQDVMLRLWSLHADLTDAAHMTALARVAARHCCIDSLRRHRLLSIDDARHAVGLDAAADLRMPVEDEEQTAWLMRKMRQLPSTEYQVLRLRQVEERSTEEIAALLGIAPSSVATLLSRARRRLLAAIRRQRTK